MARNNLLFIILSGVLLFSCNKSVKNTGLSDQELNDLALERGNLISEKTQIALASQLKRVVENKGVKDALEYCNVRAYPIVDSLETAFQAGIKRASHRTRNQADKPDQNEQEIIRNYLRNMEEGKVPEVQVIIDSATVHYYKPIILNAPLCLNCHGSENEDIDAENLRVIRSLYPEDKATGHQMGDLRGIWSITFRKEAFSGR